jgi:hypothetical protein
MRLKALHEGERSERVDPEASLTHLSRSAQLIETAFRKLLMKLTALCAHHSHGSFPLHPAGFFELPIV